MNIDSVHLAFRSTAEGAQKVLNELEAELADVKARRDRILADISKANDASVRDQRARMELPALNKSNVETGRLIVSLEREVAEARKRVAIVEAHAAAAKEKQAAEHGGTGRLVQLEIRAPDGRVLRQFHKSVDAARSALQPGYEVTGQVIGSGVVSPIGPGARSFMASLLDAGGGELLEFLEAHGIVGCIAQAPELAGDKESVQ
jgi:hypothetical protein